MISQKFRHTIKKYGLVKRGERIVVAVSGGPDSVTLLYLLFGLKDELGLHLYVAHLDHMLRPHSARDAEFVKSLAAKLGLPVVVGKAGIKKAAVKGSPEELARNIRLDFLFGVARRLKARKICLGHNLDDQAETVLMRLIRGSGLYGLSAILPKKKMSAFTLIRPLLETRRKEIAAYLNKKKIPFCIDETNKQDIYLRNKLRNRLLPLLEKEYNKNIKEVLSNTALSSGYDYDYLVCAALRVLKGQGRKVKLSGFLKLHPAMQNLAMRISIARLKGDTRRITFQHIEEIRDLAMHRPVGSVVDLPKGVSVLKSKTHLVLRI
jgi:tRNA(Ile)-lysidine synthase